MNIRNTATRYGFVAQSLHWLIAVGIVAQYFLAEAGEENEGAALAPFGAESVHRALGMSLLALAVLRLAWRLLELPPERPLTMKSYEIGLARVAHFAFYVLLFAIPLSGWALASTGGESLSFLGWFDLPHFQPVAPLQLPWLEGGRLSKDQLEELHEILFNVLAGLAVLHIVAALTHHFIERDGVLRSMLPWGQRTPRA